MQDSSLSQLENEVARIVDDRHAIKRIQKIDYLRLCQKATKLATDNPDVRQDVAYAMTSLWLAVGPQIKDPAVEYIGSMFAELELPDGLVFLRPGQNVDECWSELAKAIDSGLRQHK